LVAERTVGVVVVTAVGNETIAPRVAEGARVDGDAGAETDGLDINVEYDEGVIIGEASG
jgi:hypothetical protein